MKREFRIERLCFTFSYWPFVPHEADDKSSIHMYSKEPLGLEGKHSIISNHTASLIFERSWWGLDMLDYWTHGYIVINMPYSLFASDIL